MMIVPRHGESSRKLTECMAWLQAIEGQLTGLLIEDAATIAVVNQ